MFFRFLFFGVSEANFFKLHGLEMIFLIFIQKLLQILDDDQKAVNDISNRIIDIYNYISIFERKTFIKICKEVNIQ
jgi:hypothetical protein